MSPACQTVLRKVSLTVRDTLYLGISECTGLILATAAAPGPLPGGSHPPGELTDKSSLQALLGRPLRVCCPGSWPFFSPCSLPPFPSLLHSQFHQQGCSFVCLCLPTWKPHHLLISAETPLRRTHLPPRLPPVPTRVAPWPSFLLHCLRHPTYSSTSPCSVNAGSGCLTLPQHRAGFIKADASPATER